MSQKCSQCGAILSSYNTGQVCFPCQKKRKDTIVERIASSKCERLEYLDFLLTSKTSEKMMAMPQGGASSGGLHFQSGAPGSTRNRQASLETIEEGLANSKPRIQISLHPGALKRAIAARSASHSRF
jgi:hypothetical protein